MNFQGILFQDGLDLNRIFSDLLEGLEENARLDEKRKFINTILPLHKYTLLNGFLEYYVLSDASLLNCLRIFLDENTKFFEFRITDDQTTIKAILEIIQTYCPTIEICDFRSLFMDTENKENFKTFLKKTTSLKSLMVRCIPFNCLIFELMLDEDFDLLDQDVKIGLQKIEFINGSYLPTSDCAKLLKILPNLKSLGYSQSLGPLFTDYSEDEVIANKLNNLTEIGDDNTSLEYLEYFVRLCPKTTKIYLYKPEKKVVENLWKFPLLTEVDIKLEDPDYTELYNLLERIGRQIKILQSHHIVLENQSVPDLKTLRDLCPELVQLCINGDLIELEQEEDMVY